MLLKRYLLYTPTWGKAQYYRDVHGIANRFSVDVNGTELPQGRSYCYI